jgi:hypothetical protein
MTRGGGSVAAAVRMCVGRGVRGRARVFGACGCVHACMLACASAGARGAGPLRALAGCEHTLEVSDQVLNTQSPGPNDMGVPM